jgi:hypothetical protein
VESLNGNRNGFSSDDERTVLRVLHGDGSLALTLPAIDAGVQGPSHEMFLGDADGTGTFFLEIEGTSFSDQIAEYRIALELVSAQGEDEPNDAPDAATPVSFPVVAYGARDPGGADEDCFAFALPAPLASDESLRVSLDNMLSTSSTVSELRLHRADGSLVARAVATFPRVIAADLPAGPLVACAARDPLATGQSAFPYRLRAEIGAPAERAANDTVGESLDFDASSGDESVLVDGTVAADVHNNTTGTDRAGDPDRFAIEGNAPGTCLRVRALNLTSTRTLILGGSAGHLDEDTVPEVLTVAALDGAPVAVSDLVTVNQASDASLADRVTVDNYRLVARDAGACEAEPNDVVAAATPIAEGEALLAHVRFGDLDLFAWDAPAVGAGEALVLRAQNLSDASPLRVRALDDVEAELAIDADDAVELRVAGPRSAGRVYLELAHSAAGGKSGDVVAVEVLRD